MSTTPNVQALTEQAASAVESGDPADAKRFAQATGMQPTDFQAQLQAQGAEQLALAVQQHMDQQGNVQDDDAAFEAAMREQQREHEEMMASEPQVAWRASGWQMDDDGITETKSCILVFEGVFNAALMSSERGGDESITAFGPDRGSLDEAMQDVKAGPGAFAEVSAHEHSEQGNVQKAVFELPSLEMRSALAAQFYQELLDSVETFTGVAEQYGAGTLADLFHLHAAIGNNDFIDAWPTSSVMEIIEGLPSAGKWLQYASIQSDNGLERECEISKIRSLQAESKPRAEKDDSPSPGM